MEATFTDGFVLGLGMLFAWSLSVALTLSIVLIWMRVRG